MRAISYTVHGLVPASCVFADRYNREEVVRSLGNEINLNPPLLLSQLPDIPEELLKLDQVTVQSTDVNPQVWWKSEGPVENNVTLTLFTSDLSNSGLRFCHSA